MKAYVKVLITLIVLGVLGAVVWLVYSMYAPSEEVMVQTEKVAVGDLMSVISASGTVEPEELVNVGAQVSGKIMAFGKGADGKPIDYGTRVTKGMLLAQIDDVLYDAALREAQAQKLQAEVAILSADASIKQAKAQLALAKSNFERAERLLPTKSISTADYDSRKAEYDVRLANIAVAEAERKQAEAKLAIAEASLIKAQRNMDYCVISSPVDGVIVDRRVSIGQTLVSNMSASSIFLIAKDLRKMQVWVSVNEADIGNIHVGMPVIFSVDAFPGQEFKGTVHKIRLNATMSQNVVTYVVEVSTDNSDGKLLPYLTANVKFVRQRKDQVPNVPNAALRFMPPENMIAPGGMEMLNSFKRGEGKRLLWVKAENGKLRPVEVRTGLNNGVATEIISDTLRPGDEIVSGVRIVTAEEAAQNKGGSRSPFLPEPPKRRGNNPNKPAQSADGPRR